MPENNSILETTVQIYSSASNPKETCIVVSYDQEVIDTSIVRKGFTAQAKSTGCLHLKLNKETNFPETNVEYPHVPAAVISTETNGVANMLVVIASAGNIQNALDGIKAHLLKLNEIDREKVDSMTDGDLGFIFVFDTKTRKYFFETAPLECKMVINIDFRGKPQRMFQDDNKVLKQQLTALEQKHSMLQARFDQRMGELQAEIAALEKKKKWISLDQPVHLASPTSNSRIKLEQLPSNATEVLIFVQSCCGTVQSNFDIRLDLYTKIGDEEYHQYHYSKGYPPQNAYAFNSNNLWFPISASDLNLYWKLNRGYDGNSGASLYLIGYKV